MRTIFTALITFGIFAFPASAQSSVSDAQYTTLARCAGIAQAANRQAQRFDAAFAAAGRSRSGVVKLEAIRVNEQTREAFYAADRKRRKAMLQTLAGDCAALAPG